MEGNDEIVKMIQLLKRNNYTFKKVEPSHRYGCVTAIFVKDILFSDIHGNSVNDSPIEVNITFDATMDQSYPYQVEDEDADEYGEYEPNIGKSREFVAGIFNKHKKNNSTRKSSISSLSSGSHSSSRTKSKH